MPKVEPEYVRERLIKEATNSGHFTWLLASLDFFETKNKWLFAFRKSGSTVLIALEPLVPGGIYTDSEFLLAWVEFAESTEGVTFTFVGIYGPFCSFLKKHHFQSMLCGQEPWVLTKNFIPSGKKGLGVRSSRNKAIRLGLTVEEWKPDDFSADEHQQEVFDIQKSWNERHLFVLDGFLLAIKPFAYSQDRRYFILKSKLRVEGFAIATPIGGRGSYYLEDLICRKDPMHGSGELLTSEVLRLLYESGVQEASLGVVSTIGESDHLSNDLPRRIGGLLATLRFFFSFFYSFRGIKLFRKRFKPVRWEPIYISVHFKATQSGVQGPRTLLWFKVWLALIRAVHPKIYFSWGRVGRSFLEFAKTYALTLSFVSLSFLVFATVNRFGTLPDDVLKQFAVHYSSHWAQWIMRSLVSDFLYSSPWHFYINISGMILFFPAVEKTYRRGFLIPLLITFCLLSDIFNYLTLVKPLQFLNPKIYAILLQQNDVGGSLILSLVLGLWVFHLKRYKDVVFSLVLSIGIVLLALVANKRHVLLLNLNHILAFSGGYLVARINDIYFKWGARFGKKTSQLH